MSHFQHPGTQDEPEAFGGEAIETTVLDLGDEAVAAELGDQA
jgi:hypothetical protein